MSSGVYKITCIPSGKFYIGSSQDVSIRFRTHRSALRSNRHENLYLQRAWNKYGETAFAFEFVQECNVRELLGCEQYYIDNMKPEFNMLPTAGTVRGFIHSVESKNKMRVSKLGKKRNPHTEEVKSRISNSNISIHRSQCTKDKISESQSEIWILTSPNNELIEVKNLTKFCRENNLTKSGMLKVANGTRHQHKGWTCQRANSYVSK